MRQWVKNRSYVAKGVGMGIREVIMGMSSWRSHLKYSHQAALVQTVNLEHTCGADNMKHLVKSREAVVTIKVDDTIRYLPW